VLSCTFTALEFSQKQEFQVSQGSVDALVRWVGKQLYCYVANIFRTIHSKFHQNRLDFGDHVTKTS